VLKKVGEAAYQLDLPQHWKGHRTFNEGRIKRFEAAKFQVQEQLPTRPDPELVNGREMEYKVQEVPAKRGTGTKKEFLVRWEGYGPEDDTWEPEKNLSNAKDALRTFKARGRATKGGEYHVTVSVTKEIREQGLGRDRQGLGQEDRTEATAWSVQANPDQNRSNQVWTNQAVEVNRSLKDMTQDNERKRDSGSASVIPEERSALTGKLCRRVIALIRWQCSADSAVNDRMVRTLEAWLWRRGISIYTDRV
jgi:hypothetical protein